MSDKTDSEDDKTPDAANPPGETAAEPGKTTSDPARAKPKRRLKLTKMPKRAAEPDQERDEGPSAAAPAEATAGERPEAARVEAEPAMGEAEPAAEPSVELTEEVADVGPTQPDDDPSPRPRREPMAASSVTRRRPRGTAAVLVVLLALAAGAIAWWLWPRTDAPREAATEPAELTAAELSEIEQLLSDLQIDPGPVDGVVDEETREAIRFYQESGGLPVDGEPTAALLNDLREVAGEVN